MRNRWRDFTAQEAELLELGCKANSGDRQYRETALDVQEELGNYVGQPDAWLNGGIDWDKVDAKRFKAADRGESK